MRINDAGTVTANTKVYEGGQASMHALTHFDKFPELSMQNS